MRPLLPALAALLLVPPAAAQSPPADDALAAREVVGLFFSAAADSNLTRMGQLWGTPRGPAATVRDPADWERRVVIMQSYLRGLTARVTGVDPARQPGLRTVQVSITRENCTRTLPVTAVRTQGGAWVVNSLDLSQIGVPGRTCEEPKAAPKP